MNTQSRLVHGVPAPFRFEALSSWLGRLALSQGCRVDEAKHFLGFPSRVCRDVDGLIGSMELSSLRERCNLPPDAFAESAHLMETFNPRRWCASGWPRFRYCSLCLAERPTAYLDVHWRFIERARCLMHDCELEDHCLECKAPITAPTDMINSHAGRSGHASQRRCQRCSCDLSKAPTRFSFVRRTSLTRLERRLVQSRALPDKLWPWR
jgi:hypothetical protein